jgi:hypothetical protein
MSKGDLSHAWANAQHHMPKGWKITELRHHGQSFRPYPYAAQAQALRAEQPRADNAGDPWTATATGPAGKTVQKRGADGFDALERLIHEVRRAAP